MVGNCVSGNAHVGIKPCILYSYIRIVWFKFEITTII